MRKHLWLRALLALQIVVAMVVPAAGDQSVGRDVTVFGIGSGRIAGTDRAAAREEAIQAGLVMAVSRALADTVPMESLVSHFQVVNDTVLNRTDYFVRDYKVLTETVVSGSYRLALQATISVERLKEAVRTAGIRTGETPYPRVLLCISEKQLDDPAPRYWWGGGPPADSTVAGAVLARIFTAKNFVLIQPGPVNFPAELKPAEAVGLGRRFKADLVVVGSAGVEQIAQPDQANMRSYRGALRTAAYRVADGQSLAEVEKSVVISAEGSPDEGEVLHRAAGLAGEELAGKIDDAWFKQAALGAGIEIRVKRVGGNMANLIKFRGALTGLSGVENLQVRELTSDQAVMNATYRGSARALADAAQQLAFDTFRIEVVRAQADTLELQLVPR